MSKRIWISITGGTLFQAVLFLLVWAAQGGIADDPNASGIAFVCKAIILVGLQMALPGFMLFVSESGRSGLFIRVLAIVFDITIYSLILYGALWLRSSLRSEHTASKNPSIETS
jgi:hypothetical protein